MAFTVHLTPTFTVGDQVEVFARTTDFHDGEINAKAVDKLKVSEDITADLALPAGDYWLVGHGKTVKVTVPEGHDSRK